MIMSFEFCTITDNESISFVERKAWSDVGSTEEEAKLLHGCMIFHSMYTKDGTFLILIDMDPMKYRDLAHMVWKIVKITPNNETGEIELHSMEVTENQAMQFIKCGHLMNSAGPDLPDDPII